jgi:hypothetical protein
MARLDLRFQYGKRPNGWPGSGISRQPIEIMSVVLIVAIFPVPFWEVYCGQERMRLSEKRTLTSSLIRNLEELF